MSRVRPAIRRPLKRRTSVPRPRRRVRSGAPRRPTASIPAIRWIDPPPQPRPVERQLSGWQAADRWVPAALWLLGVLFAASALA